MAEKVCANCGAEAPAAAVFCTQCGSRDLTEAAPPPPAEQTAAATITPDSPTVPVEDTYEPPSFAARPGTAAASPPPPPPGPADEPTIADQPVAPDRTEVVDPTAVWSPPPAAPAPPPAAMPEPPAPAYVPPAPSQAAPPMAAKPATGGGRIGAVLVLLGGAAAMLGAFLEWMKITPEWTNAITLNGWDLSDDAKIAAAVGAFAVVAAFVVLSGSLRGPIRMLAAIAGIVLIALGAYDTYDILQRLPDDLAAANVSGVEISAPGLGLILVMAGGAVVLLGALAMVRSKQAIQPAAPAAPNSYDGRPAARGVGAGAPPAGGYAPPRDASQAPYPAPGQPTGGYGQAPGGYGQAPGGYAPPQSGGYPPPAPPLR